MKRRLWIENVTNITSSRDFVVTEDSQPSAPVSIFPRHFGNEWTKKQQQQQQTTPTFLFAIVLAFRHIPKKMYFSQDIADFFYTISFAFEGKFKNLFYCTCHAIVAVETIQNGDQPNILKSYNSVNVVSRLKFLFEIGA